MKSIFAAILLTLFSRAAPAHEFWMTPSTYTAGSGAQVDVSLSIGEFFTGAPIAVTTVHAASVRLLSAASVQDLTGGIPRAGTLHALRFALPSAGTHMLAYDSHPSEVVLSADKFHAYLHDEGLDAIIRSREAAGTAAKEGRERFRRHSKLLLRAGDQTDKTYAVRSGQRLEIIPLADPLKAGVGDRLSWQLLFDAKPLPGVLLKAWHKQAQQVTVVRARADPNGRVTVHLPFHGPWLLNVVHMLPGDGVGVDWESHWGSFTFELPAQAVSSGRR